MKPSSLLALPLLLATSIVAIAVVTNADENTSSAAPAPIPPETSLPPPPPPEVSTPLTASPPPPVNSPAWSPVTDVNDRTIQQVGQFAVVANFFKTGKKLVLLNVVDGVTQPYNGGNSYRLVITVAGAGPGAETTARYSVSVWGILGTTTWQLWSFAPN